MRDVPHPSSAPQADWAVIGDFLFLMQAKDSRPPQPGAVNDSLTAVLGDWPL